MQKYYENNATLGDHQDNIPDENHPHPAFYMDEKSQKAPPESMLREAQQVILGRMIGFTGTQFEVLSKNALGLSQREIANNLNLSLAKVNRIIADLKKKGFDIRKSKGGGSPVGRSDYCAESMLGLKLSKE